MIENHKHLSYLLHNILKFHSLFTYFALGFNHSVSVIIERVDLVFAC